MRKILCLIFTMLFSLLSVISVFANDYKTYSVYNGLLSISLPADYATVTFDDAENEYLLKNIGTDVEQVRSYMESQKISYLNSISPDYIREIGITVEESNNTTDLRELSSSELDSSIEALKNNFESQQSVVETINSTTMNDILYIRTKFSSKIEGVEQSRINFITIYNKKIINFNFISYSNGFSQDEIKEIDTIMTHNIKYCEPMYSSITNTSGGSDNSSKSSAKAQPSAFSSAAYKGFIGALSALLIGLVFAIPKLISSISKKRKKATDKDTIEEITADICDTTITKENGATSSVLKKDSEDSRIHQFSQIKTPEEFKDNEYFQRFNQYGKEQLEQMMSDKAEYNDKAKLALEYVYNTKYGKTPIDEQLIIPAATVTTESQQENVNIASNTNDIPSIEDKKPSNIKALYCHKCGAKLVDGAEFCSICGAKTIQPK